MTYRLDDEAALCSIEILSEAVERTCVPGVLELRMLRNALRAAVASRTTEAVKTAFAMFGRVDPDYRRLIAHEALSLAARQKGRYAPRERVVRGARLG
ncbi:hypothetical protein [Azospirillum agricola]|uniref:hypothetical protein n=1 Tax=Azospirillum agricola TaxID=1720247 RepID=UPI000A0EEEE8|nr:hypothetical protein [Azospirillum agricola]SMH58642.1 hypothetical protein SAMN02982994_4710 [Azospirillum lipoferum]